jgi:Family of unknown function (DUF6427)
MITTVFKKSTPINYSLIGILIVIFFLLTQNNLNFVTFSITNWIEKGGNLAVILFSFAAVDFITKRNGLSKDNGYTIFYYLLFLLFFPSVFNNTNLLLANFCLMLSLRRLISLQTLKFSKEKVFDATFWVFVATLFHFWSIIFILLVFISILFHVGRDYRNWVLPFIAFFSVLIGFIFFSLVVDKSLINKFLDSIYISFEFYYFKVIFQNISLSLFVMIAFFFVAALLLTLSNRSLLLNSSYKKILFWFFLGLTIFILSPNKSNDILIFTFAPLAIMASSFVEITQPKWQQEVAFSAVLLCGLICFFTQL